MSKVQALKRRWWFNEADFIQQSLCTRSKDSRIVRMSFEKFPAQRELCRLVHQLRVKRKPVKIVGLKARQVGSSSWGCGMVYHRATLKKHVSACIVGNDLEAAQAIHDKNDVFWEYQHPLMRPMRARSSRREMVFRNPKSAHRRAQGESAGLGSRIFVESANKATIGRGQSILAFLGTEVAFWPDGSHRALAIMNTVPDDPDSVVIMESTANGVGNYFYELCQQAQKPQSEWTFFFFPWFKQPEYTLPPGDEWTGEDLSQEELALVEGHGVSEGQIAWRRQTIATKCSGDVELFHQEYPSTPEEAFITSGRPAFDQHAVKRYLDSAKNGQPMHLQSRRVGTGASKIMGQPRTEGPLQMWKAPRHDGMYVIGADVAEGLEHGDFSAACVMDVATRQQVAELHCRFTPDEFARDLVVLAEFYNEAQLVIEKNKDGLQVITVCQHFYHNFYQEYAFDRLDKKRVPTIGWYMNDDKKRVIIHELNNAIRTGYIGLKSPDLLEEMRRMERDAHGRMNAPKGYNDDLVIACALAHFVCRQERMVLEQVSNMAIDEVTLHLPFDQRVAARRAAEQSGQDYGDY